MSLVKAAFVIQCLTAYHYYKYHVGLPPSWWWRFKYVNLWMIQYWRIKITSMYQIILGQKFFFWLQIWSLVWRKVSPVLWHTRPHQKHTMQMVVLKVEVRGRCSSPQSPQSSPLYSKGLWWSGVWNPSWCRVILRPGPYLRISDFEELSCKWFSSFRY